MPELRTHINLKSQNQCTDTKSVQKGMEDLRKWPGKRDQNKRWQPQHEVKDGGSGEGGKTWKTLMDAIHIILDLHNISHANHHWQCKGHSGILPLMSSHPTHSMISTALGLSGGGYQNCYKWLRVCWCWESVKSSVWRSGFSQFGSKPEPQLAVMHL